MDEVRKQVDALQYTIRDYVDEPDSAAATELQRSVKGLLDSIDANRDDDYILATVKQVERVIESVRAARIMDEHHWDDVRDRFRLIKDAVRRLQ